jgi:hypothetical protein
MSRDVAVAAVLHRISQTVEIACAAVPWGGLRGFQIASQIQRAAVLRRLRCCAPHTPIYALRGAWERAAGAWKPQGVTPRRQQSPNEGGIRRTLSDWESDG